MNTNTKLKTTAHLSNQEIEEIYRRQLRLYWEIDFINRCIDRRQEESGLCHLPYETLAEEKELLEQAYELYLKREDSNTAYNVTLDLVIDEIEHLIKNAETFQDMTAEQEVDG